MSRTLINFLLDAFLLFLLLTLIWATFVLQFVFPPATASDGWVLWGMDYNGWNRVQFGLFCVMIAGILVHIILHWTWVCAVIAKRFFGVKPKAEDDGTLTLYGVGALVVVFNVIGGLLAAAYFTIQPPVY